MPHIPREIAPHLRTPALIVFLENVRHNVRTVLRHLDGDPDRWRPHVKTTKMAAIVELLADAGLRAFKCATVREAALVASVLEKRNDEGDLLVAYPHGGANLRELAAVAERAPHVRWSIIAESRDAAAAIPASIGIFIDLNSGMNRSGVSIDRPDAILDLAGAAGERFRGLHLYDGHLTAHDSKEMARGFDAALAIVRLLAEEGIRTGEVVTSGSPTFHLAGNDDRLRAVTRHRVSPGTAVFHDGRNADPSGPDLRAAAYVVTRVVSRPAPDRITCDAGSKAISVDAGHPAVTVADHPELTALVPSEEHLPMQVGAGKEAPAVGELLLLLPRHVCPTVNLAEEAILVDVDGSIRTEPVAARAHSRQELP